MTLLLQQITELRKELKAAYFSDDTQAQWHITNRLLTVYAELADRLLKQEGNSDASNAVSPAVSSCVEIAEDAPLYLNCPGGLPRD